MSFFFCLDWLGLQVGNEDETFELEGWRVFSCFSLILQINTYRTHRLARFCYANGLIGCGRSPSGLSWNKSGNLEKAACGGQVDEKSFQCFIPRLRLKIWYCTIFFWYWLFIHELIDIQQIVTMYTIYCPYIVIKNVKKNIKTAWFCLRSLEHSWFLFQISKAVTTSTVYSCIFHHLPSRPSPRMQTEHEASKDMYKTTAFE